MHEKCLISKIEVQKLFLIFNKAIKQEIHAQYAILHGSSSTRKKVSSNILFQIDNYYNEYDWQPTQSYRLQQQHQQQQHHQQHQQQQHHQIVPETYQYQYQLPTTAIDYTDNTTENGVDVDSRLWKIQSLLSDLKGNSHHQEPSYEENGKSLLRMRLFR